MDGEITCSSSRMYTLEEQFIHGLNEKTMLDEIIRELTAKDNNE